MRTLSYYILVASVIYLCMGILLAKVFEPFPVFVVGVSNDR